MNKVRGERVITVGGQRYTLRPTHEALARIEGKLDAGLLEVARRYLQALPRMTDTATILNETSRTGGVELPYSQAFEYALEYSAEANAAALGLLIDRFGPAEQAAGKAEAAAS